MFSGVEYQTIVHLKVLWKNNRIVCNLQFEEKVEAIRLLTIYAEETQSQYNECFAEVQ